MSVKEVNIYEDVYTREQVRHMIDNYVPSLLRPEQWPGFAGVDIVEDSYIKEHFFDFMGYEEGANYMPTSSIVIDMATWFRAADMSPTEEIMYVIFLSAGQTWACTYISLLGDISRIVLATEKGTSFAGSDEGAKTSLIRAIDICKTMFPKDYLNIVRVAYENLKNLRRND